MLPMHTCANSDHLNGPIHIIHPTAGNNMHATVVLMWSR
jgi:hypothetical protein